MKEKKLLFLFLILSAVGAVVWYFVLHPRGQSRESADGEIITEKLGVDNPQLHWWKITAARNTVYESGRRNIFSAAAVSAGAVRPRKKPAIVKGPPQPVSQLPTPPPAPVVAPLPLKYYGFASAVSRDPNRAFFTDGEHVYVVGEGEVLLGRFRVVRIERTRVEYEEIASGLRGSVPLEPQDAPS